MPQVQPPTQIVQTPAISPRRDHRVYARQSWSDDWQTRVGQQELKYLRCRAITTSLSPAFSTCELAWVVGEQKREDETAFAQVNELDLRGWFVKVVLLPPEPADPAGQTAQQQASSGNQNPPGPEEEDDAAEIPLFVGFIPEAAFDARGDVSRHSPEQRGVQSILAYGLEGLLDLKVIGSSRVRYPAGSGADTYRTIEHGLVFNEVYDRGWAGIAGGRKVGNRSTARDANAGSYVFDGGPNAGLWTAYDVVEYLLAAHAPSAEPSAITWRINPLRPSAGGDPEDALYAALTAWVPPALPVEGMTVKGVLDRLFDRRLGLGWRVGMAIDEDGVETIYLKIYSLVDQDVAFGAPTGDPGGAAGLMLPASREQVDWRFTEATPLGPIHVESDALTRYGKIVVQGERLLSCFTLRCDDGLGGAAGSGAVNADGSRDVPNAVLRPAWDATEQAAYTAGATGGVENDPDLNDAVRSAAMFRHVFTTFLVKPDWDFILYPQSATGAQAASPFVNPDGRITEPQLVASFCRIWGQTFERFVPFPTRATQTSTEFDREYLPAFAIILDPSSGGFVDVAASAPGPGCQLRLLDRALGIEVRAANNHAIALAQTGFTAGNTNATPTHDYRTMYVTVAMRTDERLRCEETIVGGDPNLELRITLDDAELWYVVPGTVKGVLATGQPDRHVGGVVRDDGERLRQVAALAKAWYGRPRSRVQVTALRVEPGSPPGTLVRRIVDARVAGGASYETPVSTVITEKVLDLDRQTTTFRTGYAELAVELTGGRLVGADGKRRR